MNRVLAMLGILAFGISALATTSGCASSQRCFGQDRADRGRCATGNCREVHADNRCLDEYGDSMVGPAGPDGPTGPEGNRGPSGQTGAPGYAMAGPRGETGPMGYAGETGSTGSMGAQGAVVRGRAGPQGPMGSPGPQGAMGVTGSRGESAAGYAGAMGAQGQQGSQGPTGMTGARGPTTEGPTGPAGRAGPSGVQGATGYAGGQGMTTPGVGGPTGPSGPRGPQGASGAMGSPGNPGSVDCWTPYREFFFDSGSSDLADSERNKAREIASYLNQNSTMQIGIDGFTDGRGSDRRNRNLNERRIRSVREALTSAGVPAFKIREGTFSEAGPRREGRVEVLINTAPR